MSQKTNSGSKLSFGVVMLILSLMGSLTTGTAAAESTLQFHRVPTQFIAALGDPEATYGKGAETWGIWRKDPGPRGVWLKQFDKLVANENKGPGGWTHDPADWWLDENGLIMEKPDFPLPAGKYLVTGDRETTTVLIVHPKTDAGEQFWELANGAKLYDVTHLPCRSANYTTADGGSCTPAAANQSDWPVIPGSIMPDVNGCARQDYSVLFAIAIAVES
jgi:hypothetical protein